MVIEIVLRVNSVVLTVNFTLDRKNWFFSHVLWKNNKKNQCCKKGRRSHPFPIHHHKHWLVPDNNEDIYFHYFSRLFTCASFGSPFVINFIQRFLCIVFFFYSHAHQTPCQNTRLHKWWITSKRVWSYKIYERRIPTCKYSTQNIFISTAYLIGKYEHCEYY